MALKIARASPDSLSVGAEVQGYGHQRTDDELFELFHELDASEQLVLGFGVHGDGLVVV